MTITDIVSFFNNKKDEKLKIVVFMFFTVLSRTVPHIGVEPILNVIYESCLGYGGNIALIINWLTLLKILIPWSFTPLYQPKNVFLSIIAYICIYRVVETSLIEK